ncbi:hypothetical protein LWI28_006596 [Acer negundo]|uniref:BED-type domain-containing protein n=1 Tax=Acer negundo TaxID=4023 RepID=A0AAD5NLB7_ACENE|nr:hypothetical protein LWI28_006596 [Acer negundo]
MASGGNSSRNLNKEKGPMHNLLEHVGGDVNYDRSYHEFLQDQFGSDHPSSPNPPLIIPEFDGLNHDPNTTNTNENLSNPPPPSNYFFAGEGEEKQMKSILFRVHMKKTELDGRFFHIQCNYCSKSYKTAKSFGYGTYWAHIKRSHPSEFEKSNNQAQIARYATSGGNILEPRRSVMSPQSLEMQACVDDWTKAKYRQQELQPEIVNDFFKDDQTTGTEGSD